MYLFDVVVGGGGYSKEYYNPGGGVPAVLAVRWPTGTIDPSPLSTLLHNLHPPSPYFLFLTPLMFSI